jgi:pSer/pThr/pTyr-binding forkhead associated (FHA) protein
MNVKLVVEKGNTRTRTLYVRQEEAVFGRERGCDFRIASSEVSRRHCRLRARDGYVTVEDLNSSNGTQLNGEPVRGRQVVRPGDRLGIGPVTFIVEYQLTPEAIDRLLRGEESAEALPEVQPVEEVEEVEPVEELMEVEPVEEEFIPAAEVVEAEAPPLDELELIEAEEFQLPESEDLREILGGLDEDEPDRKRSKKRR